MLAILLSSLAFARPYDKPSRAFATLVSSDEYSIGAQALLCSYGRIATKQITFVVMWDPKNVSPAAMDRLHEFVTVDNSARGTAAQKQSRHAAYAKFNLWSLAYDQVLYMDADVVMLHDPEPAFNFLTDGVEIAYVGKRSYFNNGVMVVKPSKATYEGLLKVFHAWAHFDENGNVDQDMVVALHHAKKPNDAILVHAIGNPKPWTRILTEGSSVDGQRIDKPQRSFWDRIRGRPGKTVQREWSDTIYGALLHAVLVGRCSYLRFDLSF